MGQSLYAAHIDQKLAAVRHAMADENLDQIIFYSGTTKYGFRDDLPHPFKANPYFLEWLPLNVPDCFLWIGANASKPTLLINEPDDYWHSKALPLAEEVEALFEIRRYSDWSMVDQGFLANPYSAIIGDLEGPAIPPHESLGINPEPLIDQLDAGRAVKTPWELENIRQANRTAVKGHQRAAQLFHEGASELEIHLGYLDAVGSLEADMPYGNIIGLNENAAVLHHWRLGRTRPDHARSMLIDAGAAHCGYAADITRSYARDAGVYADLITEMDTLQRAITEQVAPGVPYPDLHGNALDLIGEMLQRCGLLLVDPSHNHYNRIVAAFMPHGLGHFLGIQVHDKGGFDPKKDYADRYPNLRLTATLEAGNVVTIEPGLYLIPKLLEELKSPETKACIDWDLVEALKPYGGIRIEDDMIVTNTGAENATREAFAALTG